MKYVVCSLLSGNYECQAAMTNNSSSVWCVKKLRTVQYGTVHCLHENTTHQHCTLARHVSARGILHFSNLQIQLVSIDCRPGVRFWLLGH